MALFVIEIEDDENGGAWVRNKVKRYEEDGPNPTLAEKLGWSLIDNCIPEEMEYLRRVHLVS